MKIIIDISDTLMEYIVKGRDLSEEQNDEMALAIANGTPLPKGHGRLIDADELKKNKYHDYNRYENAVAVAQIDWADTIIEADKCTYKETGCGSCKRQLDCPMEVEGSDNE